MGNPRRHYKQALRYLAYSLVYMEDKSLAYQLFEETSTEKLERFILDKKAQIPEKKFFFNAGGAEERVINDADEEGIDSFNAACGGLDEFEHFIGLIGEDEDDET